MESTLKVGFVCVVTVVVSLFIYGCYWAAKTVSYEIFYADMVKSSIVEMVKPEALKK